VDKRSELNQAIRRLPRPLARELKYYRDKLERNAKKRGAFLNVKKSPTGLSVEAEDTVEKCLEWIHEHTKQ